MAALLAYASFGGVARAGTIFFEDFENYSVSGDTNPGIPLLAEGSNELWYGGRFEPQKNGNVNQDVAIRNLPGTFPVHRKYARFEDDAGIMFQVSTLGSIDVTLEFDWRTHLISSGDNFIAGYYVGDFDVVNDTPDGSPQPDLVHDFVADGPNWSTGGWVEILRDADSLSWSHEEIELPGTANQSSVWIAFWLDNGEGDYGKVDNILVTPEPASMVLMLGGMLVAMRRRRRMA